MTSNYEIEMIAGAIVDTLKENDFFNEHPFVGQSELHTKLIEKMTEKYGMTGEILLTDKEFLQAANEVSEAAISETLENLSEKGAISMSIGEGGEIYYSANPDFDMDKLIDSGNEQM